MAEADHKGAVRAQFGANAEKYVTSATHAQGSDLDLVVPWLDPQPAWVALDVATGGGHVAKALSPRVATVIAADLTAPMLAAARRHLEGAGCRNVVYVVADAESLPFLEAAFDCVTCRIAAHHFPDPPRFVAEVARVLKPGGRALLIDNLAPEEPDLAAFFNELERMRDPSHVRCAPLSEWRAWLAAAGLTERDARIGRKKHPFRDWVERTATSQAQMAAVEAYALAASPAAREHFAIEAAAGRMVSWTAYDLTLLAAKG